MKNKDSEQDEERGVWEKWTLSRSIKDGFQNKEREREREKGNMNVGTEPHLNDEDTKIKWELFDWK